MESWYNFRMGTCRRWLSVFFLAVFAGTLYFFAHNALADTSDRAPKPEVLVISVSGVINPVSSEFIIKSVDKAAAMKAEALIIQLDTPGGLVDSMRVIVKHILSSPVPVIVYVSPSGARSASAGVFITLAAHVAAMAPGTNIGAAHPVTIGDKLDKVSAEKAANDLAAYIKSLANLRGRNAAWAEEAVRKSVSVTDSQALSIKIIDLVAKDMDALLKALDGRKVRMADSEKELHTAEARIVTEEMGMRQKVLNVIGDPNVAYILMLLGFYGLIFELTNPGVVLPGVIGVISLVLAFYAFQTLPVNYAGLILIIVGIILFLLEVKIASYGALTVGGIVSLTLGSIMLFDSPEPFFRVSLTIILPAVMVTALLFFATFRLAYKAHSRKPVTGREGLIGFIGSALSEVGPQGGSVRVRGEIWSAWSDEQIAAGEKIAVEEIKGLRVRVRKIPAS
jgi:membrane-bound serine protease (ClpP class)